MRTETGKYFAVLSILAFLITGVSTYSFASTQDVETRNVAENIESEVDHETLARQYENLAREMQAKAKEQEEIFEHKPSSNSFGRNARNIKSHIAFRVREYEQAAKENFEKAAYHHKVAEKQTDWRSAIKTNRANSKESS